VIELQHLPRAGERSMLGPTCEPDCPACAAAEARRAIQEKASEGVRAIVFEMWLDAIATGERTLETALEEIGGPLAKLTRFERDQVLGQFVRRAMQLLPAPYKGGKPRGLPSAWRRENYNIIELIREHEGLPLTVEGEAFERGAHVWAEWGIRVTARMVRDAYLRERRER
jgi:hypothetical protein